MKYFRTELLARCRSLDDGVSEPAYAEWEQAAAAYRARLESLRPLLPAGVKKVVARLALHDAEVLGVSLWDGSPRFSLLLRLEGFDGRAGDVVALTYRTLLTEGVHRQPPSRPGERVFVGYDEFDRDEAGGYFVHRLTLTDGAELEVRFHGLRVHRLPALVPPSEMAKQTA